MNGSLEVKTRESEKRQIMLMQKFGSMSRFSHQGYLTSPNDLPLPFTDEEFALYTRHKPVSPEGKHVPMPTNTNWIRLPFKDIWDEESQRYRRILYIDYMLERAANEIFRLRQAFGCERRFRI